MNRLRTSYNHSAGAAKFLCAALLGALFGCSPAPVAVDLVVENVTVYSGSDATPLIASVAIRDGRFFKIGPPDEHSIIANETIDGTGKFMTPGLWDAHVHVRSSRERGLDVETFVESEVTSIQEDIGQWIKAQVTILIDVRLTILHFGQFIGRHSARIGINTSVV